jgi:plasmid stabilization system protein ParE
MIVHIAAEAEHDLEAIGDFIARDSPLRALSFIGELRAKCLDLTDLAESFPLVPRYEARGIRRRVHGSYLIFYRIETERLVVLHVLHGSMDYEPILFPS